MWSKLILFIVLVGAGCLVLGSHAEAQSERPECCARPLPKPTVRYRVTVEDERGRRLRTFRHHGRPYVLGEMGARYAIRVHNQTSRRVEAVVSVDGRDAISGRVADYVHFRGYVVPPYGSTLIRGFRQSLDRVAAFRFTDHSDSYSARLGTSQNVGVIGVAFFAERIWSRRHWRPADPAEEDADERRLPRRPKRSRVDSEPLPGRSRAGRGATPPLRPPQRLGTRYGESRFSPVSEIPFERAHRTVPNRIVRLYYDDAEGLEARGIEVLPPPPPNRPWPLPEPFPQRYAPPPPPQRLR